MHKKTNAKNKTNMNGRSGRTSRTSWRGRTSAGHVPKKEQRISPFEPRHHISFSQQQAVPQSVCHTKGHRFGLSLILASWHPSILASLPSSSLLYPWAPLILASIAIKCERTKVCNANGGLKIKQRARRSYRDGHIRGSIIKRELEKILQNNIQIIIK